MSYQFISSEKELLVDIQNTHYMHPVLRRIEQFVQQHGGGAQAWKNAFNETNRCLQDAKGEVEGMLNERKLQGEIRDIRQAMKSIAGNAFSKLIVYVFLKNKIVGNVDPKVFITSKLSKIKNFNKIATINVANETQKPDVDLVIFTLKEDGELHKCIIISLKTSLRERAGQTYRWKLLMEIATTENAIKQRYDISYDSDTIPLVCFVTANFYDEIDQPQQRGMLKFFSKSFIAKSKSRDFISPLSHLIDFVRQELCN